MLRWNWLLHNVVADLYGPYFLLFYAIVIVALIVACHRSIRSVDRTQDLDPPEIPAKLDPYEIAYLRGGENEVTRVAIASLIQRGLLQITEEKKWWSDDQGDRQGPQAGIPASWSPIEARVLKWSGFPAAPADLPAEWHSRLAPGRVRPYEAELAEKNLLAPQEMKEWLAAALVDRLGDHHRAGPVQARRSASRRAHQRALPLRDGSGRRTCYSRPPAGSSRASATWARPISSD